MPESWELAEEQEANEAAGEVDYCLEEQLDDMGFEARALRPLTLARPLSCTPFWCAYNTFSRPKTQAEERSFAEELVTGMAKFTTVAADDEKMLSYALSPVPVPLQREIDAFILHRTATFAARRAGGAVVSVSAEGDKQARACSPPLSLLPIQ